MARILLAANSSWNIQHFRSGLLESLIRDGHDIITASPDERGVTISHQAIQHCKWSLDRFEPGNRRQHKIHAQHRELNLRTASGRVPGIYNQTQRLRLLSLQVHEGGGRSECKRSWDSILG